MGFSKFLFQLFVFAFVFTSNAFAESNEGEDALIREIIKENLNEIDAKKVMGKVPVGLSTKPIDPKCNPKRLEEIALSNANNSNQYAKLMNKYVRDCGDELSSNSYNGLLGLLEYSTYEYSFLSHRSISLKKFTLSSGQVIPAIVAIKPDGKTRPMVIIRCGVFCGASVSSSTKTYLMHLFDQSPFNVMLLANHTAADYIQSNNMASMGGWVEGKETWDFGQWLKYQSSYKNIISSLHFVGLSLGGNAAIIGSYYNDIFPDVYGDKVFNSVTAVCPVVSLRPTLEKLYGRTVVGRVFSSFTKNHFYSLRSYLSDVSDLVTEEVMPKDREKLPDYLGYLMSTSLNRRGIASTPDSFFKSNNFWNIKKTIQTPLLAFASKDDFIVDYGLNSKVLHDDDHYEKIESTGVIPVDYGTHCAFSASYGFEFTSLVLRDFVLINSPEYKTKYMSVGSLNWPVKYPKVGNDSVHIEQVWKFESKSENAKVVFSIFDKNMNWKCRNKSPWNKDRECVNTETILVPIKNLSDLNGYIPQSDSEAESLSREFNAKAELVKNGIPISGTNASKFSVRYRW